MKELEEAWVSNMTEFIKFLGSTVTGWVIAGFLGFGMPLVGYFVGYYLDDIRRILRKLFKRG